MAHIPKYEEVIFATFADDCVMMEGTNLEVKKNWHSQYPTRPIHNLAATSVCKIKAISGRSFFSTNLPTSVLNLMNQLKILQIMQTY